MLPQLVQSIRKGKSARLFGKAGDANLFEVEPLMQDFRLKLVIFNPENIVDMGETGLFCPALSTRSYILNDESRKDVRGCKH